MAQSISYFSKLRAFVWTGVLTASVCGAPGAFAQHGGGGHFGGNGHFGGGGRVGSPHVSAGGTAPHSAPPIIARTPAIRVFGPPPSGVGTRNLVAVPPVRIPHPPGPI